MKQKAYQNTPYGKPCKQNRISIQCIFQLITSSLAYPPYKDVRLLQLHRLIHGQKLPDVGEVIGKAIQQRQHCHYQYGNHILLHVAYLISTCRRKAQKRGEQRSGPYIFPPQWGRHFQFFNF